VDVLGPRACTICKLDRTVCPRPIARCAPYQPSRKQPSQGTETPTWATSETRSSRLQPWRPTWSGQAPAYAQRCNISSTLSATCRTFNCRQCPPSRGEPRIGRHSSLRPTASWLEAEVKSQRRSLHSDSGVRVLERLTLDRTVRRPGTSTAAMFAETPRSSPDHAWGDRHTGPANRRTFRGRHLCAARNPPTGGRAGSAPASAPAGGC